VIKMPHWITNNFFQTIRYFDRFIGQQAHEPVYVLFRKWQGPWLSGSPSSYTYNSTYVSWEFTLWQPPVPLAGGKPRLRNLKLFVDGVELTPVASYNRVTADNEYWRDIDKGGPSNASNYGAIIAGFNTGFDPRNHVVEYQYEEICVCIDVGEESFQPDSRCVICYGTGYVGGYDQYTAAAVSEAGITVKPTNMILCRFPITSEILRINRTGGEIVTQRKSWTTASPVLHDWDMIIRQRYAGNLIHRDAETGEIPNERYWIADWEHSSARPSYSLPRPAQPNEPAISQGVTLHQKFHIVEAQPNHIIYDFPIVTG